jgi:K+-transporting ATPase ATPase A chain
MFTYGTLFAEAESRVTTSSHPFENPTTWTKWIEIFLLLVISFSLPRTFGRMVGSKKQGYAIAAVMGSLAVINVPLMSLFQLQHHGTVPTAAGAAMRFGGPTRRCSPTRPR